jgi:ABC-type Fe3+/spermidine/putrescine transport system ATPase subunit
MGFTTEQIQQFMPDIEAFAEIGEYFDEPLRTYSSGMQMRVAFSLVTARQPELLIIDEALSVGDAYFQQKCMKKIHSLKNSGVSIIFVSHDVNSVKMICDKAILIDEGLLIDKGEPNEIIKFYRNMTLNKSHQGDLKFRQKKLEAQTKQKNNEPTHHGETGEVELLEFSIRDVNDREVNYVVSENILRICFKIQSKKYLEDPHFGIIIRDKFGVSAFETNTYCMHIKSKPVNTGDSVGVEFTFACNLAPADYSISIGVANKGYDRSSFKEYLLFMQDLEMFKIIENGDAIYYSGYTNLRPTFASHINEQNFL